MEEEEEEEGREDMVDDGEFKAVVEERWIGMGIAEVLALLRRKREWVVLEQVSGSMECWEIEIEVDEARRRGQLSSSSSIVVGRAGVEYDFGLGFGLS